MYNHLDQSWKSQPKLMSEAILRAAAERIQEYAQQQQLDRIAVVYHGGEPLLLGTERLVAHAALLRSLLPAVRVEFSLQTNGVLLRETDVLAFQQQGIQVSLSLDGPATAHDRHRLDHQGRSSFAATEQALHLLERYPDVFSGVIAVIDADNDPAELLAYFEAHTIPQLDFLLPDANYLTLPPGRGADPDRYSRWLTTCFDVWFDQYPHLKIRTFDTILAALMGIPSETDGLGLGDVSLITIETDGSYHDLDVLKITGHGTGLAGESVFSAPLHTATISEQVGAHRLRLRKEGLSVQCQQCAVVDVCGGGAVAHRYSAEGYANPSIYCTELQQLIAHADFRATEQLRAELNQYQPKPLGLEPALIDQFERVSGASNTFLAIKAAFEARQVNSLTRALGIAAQEPAAREFVASLQALSPEQLQHLAIQPSLVAWANVLQKSAAGVTVHAIDGEPIAPAPQYAEQALALAAQAETWPRVQREDDWLRLPFGDKIFFESAATAIAGATVLADALTLIARWKAPILEEMQLISPEVQFIRDPSADPNKVVSFSDNSVPGALYVQLTNARGFVDACDLADSLIHEHRHQKLYLLQRLCDIVHADFPLVASPWREELRPPTGLFHALYVFVELLDFWTFLQGDPASGWQEQAQRECLRISGQLQTGFVVVASCDLTEAGHQLLELLQERYQQLTV
jgi:uncharacterized protein